MKEALGVCAVISIVATSVPASAVTATNWPKTFEQNGTKGVVYEPQDESSANYTVLHALGAVAVTKSGTTSPAFGAVQFDAFTSADFQTGEVQLVSPRITTLKWPGKNAAASNSLEATALGSGAPIATETPTIFQSGKPAILVVFDGAPILGF